MPADRTGPVLRLAVGQDRTVHARLEGAGRTVEARGTCPDPPTPVDREDLRWYFEDYLLHPNPITDAQAARSEATLSRLGEGWFQQLFGTGPLREIWQRAAPLLGELAVEVEDFTAEAEAVLWEALTPPGNRPLCLAARLFVRTEPGTAAVVPAAQRPARILVVVARPGAGRDIPYRTVALRLLAGVGSRADAEFLRPATYERLCERLAEAAAEDRPFDILHFDGHGLYGDLSPRPPGSPPRPRGFVAFENPGAADGRRLVPGSALGRVLVQYGVRVLGLNACRSAHADGAPPGAQPYPSFAQEVFRAGVAGVLAMRHDIYIDTAAETVASVYERLVDGVSLGEAVTEARRALAARPLRSAGGPGRPLHDWAVPVVFERTPVTLAVPAGPSPAPPARQPEGLPPQPAAGFVGRDEVLLKLDRGFDRHPVICLHGMAGSGKTSVAAEFARWYATTVPGRVLWTSHRQPRTTTYLADEYAAASQEGPVLLWVWDNVDVLPGPGSAPGSVDPPATLAERLAERGTRLLVTSRHADVLSDAHRMALAPLTPRETETLAQALSVGGDRSTGTELNSDDTARLLAASRGNPLLLGALVERLRRRGSPAGADPAGDRSESEAVLAGLREIVGQDVPVDPYRARMLTRCQGYARREMLEVADRNLAELQAAPPTPGDWALLLSRLAETGLAQRVHEGGYLLHPLLPDILPGAGEAAGPWEDAAFVLALSAFGELHTLRWRGGEPGEAYAARLAEDSFVAAFRTGLAAGAWFEVTGVLSGLRAAYESTRRYATLDALTDEATEHCMDPGTGEALPGREFLWAFVSELVVQRLIRQHRLREAITLQNLRIEYDLRVLKALESDPVELDALPSVGAWFSRLGFTWGPRQLRETEEDTWRSLAVSYCDLAEAFQGLGDRRCEVCFTLGLRIFQQIGDEASVASTCHRAGQVHLEVPGLIDLDKAWELTMRGLQARQPNDARGRSISHGQLGNIAYQRAVARLAAGESADELLDTAQRHFEQSLVGLPLPDRGPAHANLGSLLMMRGRLEEGRRHHMRAIEVYEAIGAPDWAASAHLNLGAGLMKFLRFSEAREHAQAARDFYTAVGNEAETARATVLLHALDVLEQGTAGGTAV